MFSADGCVILTALLFQIADVACVVSSCHLLKKIQKTFNCTIMNNEFYLKA